MRQGVNPTNGNVMSSNVVGPGDVRRTASRHMKLAPKQQPFPMGRSSLKDK